MNEKQANAIINLLVSIEKKLNSISNALEEFYSYFFLVIFAFDIFLWLGFVPFFAYLATVLFGPA